MIVFFVGERHRVTIDAYLQTWARTVAQHARVVTYEALPLHRELTAAAFVFTDLERLTDAECARAIELASRIRSAGGRVLNEPSKLLRRYDLLRTLHERGLNTFTVHRVGDGPVAPDIRYPVFVRHERQHTGPQTPLLHDATELTTAIAKLKASAGPDHDLLIAEYEDTSAADGMFRKYSAMRVGDRFVPRHVLFSTNWVGKLLDVMTDATIGEEDAYVERNPHEALLRPIFDVAGIDYGRIDYAIRSGGAPGAPEQVVTWEINTNPIIVPPPEKCGPKRLWSQGTSSAAIQAGLDVLAKGTDVRVNVCSLPPVIGRLERSRHAFMFLTGIWNMIGRSKPGRRMTYALRRSLDLAADVTTRDAMLR